MLGRHARVAAITSGLLIAQQVAGKAARDALFLTSFRASYLPYAMGCGAVLSLAAVQWLSRLMVRHSPASIAPLLFSVNCVLFGCEWALSLGSPPAAALMLYLHTAVLGPVTVSTFWSLINERFDPHTGKRAIARIAGGGTLGGVLGGLAAWRASSFLQPRTLLVVLAVVNACAVVGALALRPAGKLPSSEAASPSTAAGSPFAPLRGSAFLRNLAMLVALGGASTALLDYLFSAQAVAHFGKGPALLAFFSLFWLAVGVLSFLLQLSLGRLALEKLGLAVNIAVLPGIILLGGGLGLAVPGLLSAALLRGAEAVQRNTLFRSAYELMYTPIADAQKRAAKALIDIGCDRLGTVAGSALAVLAIHVFAQLHASVMLGIVVVLALATLPLTRALHLGYVAALQQSLRERAEQPSEPERASSVAPKRDELIERLEELQPGGLTALIAPNLATDANVVDGSSARERLKAPESVLETTRQLLSGNADDARRALTRIQPHGPGVACAILLLADRELHDSAAQALSLMAPISTGQLVDSLLDPTLDFAVRRRIPSVLRGCTQQRAVDGLLLGLSDGRFEVRYECGRALFKITESNPQIVVSKEQTITALRSEISGEERIVRDAAQASSSSSDSDPDYEGLIDGLKRDRIDRSLEHLFTILCLHLEREPLRIAYRALYHDDPKFRGTALEYLSTVLPPEMRELLWPFLGEEAPLAVARSPHELLAALSAVETSG